jgi:hypothetical protein
MHARIHGQSDKRLCVFLGTMVERIDVEIVSQISAAFPAASAGITTKQVETKWHGYIDGRADLKETALSEEAVCRNMEQLRVCIRA